MRVENVERAASTQIRRVLMSVDEAAEALSIGRREVYKLMDGGSLESVKIGRRRLIPAESLDAYVQRLRAEARAAATPDDELRSAA